MNGVRRARQLLLDPHQRHCRQVGAAELRRHIEGNQTERAAFRQQRRLLLIRQAVWATRRFAREHHRLERHKFPFDEFRHEVLEHAVFIRRVRCCHA